LKYLPPYATIYNSPVGYARGKRKARRIL